MIKSIMILLTIAAHYDYEVWQTDIKNPFLNENLEEEVHIRDPFNLKMGEFGIYFDTNLCVFNDRSKIFSSRAYNSLLT